MAALLPDVDPDGLLEYSVVYTDRALNHMSQAFQQVMRDVSRGLKQTYGAAAAVVVPGSGTFGMEAVARQFALTALTSWPESGMRTSRLSSTTWVRTERPVS